MTQIFGFGLGAFVCIGGLELARWGWRRRGHGRVAPCGGRANGVYQFVSTCIKTGRGLWISGSVLWISRAGVWISLGKGEAADER
jgi:hypothetical protein